MAIYSERSSMIGTADRMRVDSRAAAIKWLLDAALKAKLAPKEE